MQEVLELNFFQFSSKSVVICWVVYLDFGEIFRFKFFCLLAVLASDLSRKLTKTCLNIRVFIPQKLIYVAAQESWKLQTNHPVCKQGERASDRDETKTYISHMNPPLLGRSGAGFGGLLGPV